MRERRLGAPAGTMPRRDDTRPDTIGEVMDRQLDPRLHALACQMIAAEDDIDRLAPELPDCTTHSILRRAREDSNF